MKKNSPLHFNKMINNLVGLKRKYDLLPIGENKNEIHKHYNKGIQQLVNCGHDGDYIISLILNKSNQSSSSHSLNSQGL